MPTLDFYNPTGKTHARALLGLLRMTLQRKHSLVWWYSRDSIATRSARTRKGAVEVDLYEDGSGLEVAAFGWWLVFGVDAKQGAWPLSQP